MSNFVLSIRLMLTAPAAGLVIRVTRGNALGVCPVSCVAALMAATTVLCVHTPAASAVSSLRGDPVRDGPVYAPCHQRGRPVACVR
jgi:hypothetical protein